MPRSIDIVGRLTKMVPTNPCRTMQLREGTFQILKEHASRYYSSPSYDEVLINMVKFYEENDDPKHYND